MRTSTNSPAFSLRRPVSDLDNAVDLGRIGRCATGRHGRSNLVDQDALHGADFALHALRRNLLLQLHQTRAALFANFVRHLIGQRVRRCAIHRRVRKASNAIELSFAQKLQQVFELGLGLARESRR